MASPAPGDLVRVGGRASVQFAGDRALTLRITSVSSKPTYHGWAWITGYVLDEYGEATEKREIFVQPAGLWLMREPRPLMQPLRQPVGAY